jgi:hypothetical protein
MVKGDPQDLHEPEIMVNRHLRGPVPIPRAHSEVDQPREFERPIDAGSGPRDSCASPRALTIAATAEKNHFPSHLEPVRPGQRASVGPH